MLTDISFTFVFIGLVDFVRWGISNTTEKYLRWIMLLTIGFLIEIIRRICG